jgi:hypothetical protein
MSQVDRSTYIGGSDAPAIQGATDYKSRRDVWELLRGEREPADLSGNKHVERGNRMEPYVERDISAQDPWVNSEQIHDTFSDGGGHNGQIFLRHPDEPRIGGHPDGIGMTDDFYTLYEIKCPTMRSVKDVLSHGPKPRYYWQIVHYGMIMRRIADKPVRAFLAVFDYNRWTPYYIPVPLYDEDIDVLYENEKDMLFAAENGIPPTPKPYADETHFEVVRNNELEPLLQEYEQTKEQERNAKNKKKELKPKILSYMDTDQEECRIITPKYMATMKSNWGRYDATMLSVTKRDN